jgi:hypothetical protein
MELPIAKVRKLNVKINSKLNNITTTENLYDFVTNLKNKYITKNQQKDTRNLLLNNKLILEASKKVYNMSSKEIQVN